MPGWTKIKYIFYIINHSVRPASPQPLEGNAPARTVPKGTRPEDLNQGVAQSSRLTQVEIQAKRGRVCGVLEGP